MRPRDFPERKNRNGEADAKAITADGEGYGVEIRRVPRSFLQRCRLPYVAYIQSRIERGGR